MTSRLMGDYYYALHNLGYLQHPSPSASIGYEEGGFVSHPHPIVSATDRPTELLLLMVEPDHVALFKSINQSIIIYYVHLVYVTF